MLVRLKRYRFTIKYKKETSLYLADRLARAALPTPEHARVTDLKYSGLNSQRNLTHTTHTSQKPSFVLSAFVPILLQIAVVNFLKTLFFSFCYYIVILVF